MGRFYCVAHDTVARGSKSTSSEEVPHSNLPSYCTQKEMISVVATTVRQFT